jgi:hypothetical protein
MVYIVGEYILLNYKFSKSFKPYKKNNFKTQENFPSYNFISSPLSASLHIAQKIHPLSYPPPSIPNSSCLLLHEKLFCSASLFRILQFHLTHTRKAQKKFFPLLVVGY